MYRIKVTLQGTRPLIWRRLVISPDLTLAKLHPILQAAMGWQDYHLWEFRRDARGQARLERTKRLREVSPEVGRTLTYVYDLGDYWEHAIVVEACVAEEDGGGKTPLCIAGELACPPEDCGGVDGYDELLRILDDPRDERHAEMQEWVGVDFDPLRFSLEAVNRRLSRGRGRASGRL